MHFLFPVLQEKEVHHPSIFKKKKRRKKEPTDQVRFVTNMFILGIILVDNFFYRMAFGKEKKTLKTNQES